MGYRWTTLKGGPTQESRGADVGVPSPPDARVPDARVHDARSPRPASLRRPGILLGVGLGGFVDGILLHQLLQWHNMLSSSDSDRVGVPVHLPTDLSGLQMNVVWDGVFHVVTWLFVLTGLWVLHSRLVHAPHTRWSRRVLWGWVLVGWGLFNLVEGVVDHHILAIHHVKAGPHQLWWDLGFLALGAVLVLIGWLVTRTGRLLGAGASSPGD